MNAPPKLFRRGLVVGKFSPLHLGHALLIERALCDCEEVIVLSYSVPEYAHCARATREQWIRELFPSALALVLDQPELERLCAQEGIGAAPRLPANDADATTQRDFVGWLCVAILRTRVDAVFSSEAYGDGFAAHLCAYLRARDAGAPAVRHVCVDRARTRVPISGSAVRAAPHACRQFLPARVYASFVQRVAILGGESSGKTVLAQALAEQLGTCWAAEYGRERWHARAGQLALPDMLEIASAQVARETALSAAAARWLICDTTPLTTLFYSLDLFGNADARLDALAQRPYDHVFLCAPDFPFVQDGTRRDDAFRARQHRWYGEQLRQRGITHALLHGGVAARVQHVRERLDAAS
ncbi:MAG: AAA family ATPase [Pseudomonadota bacterium]